MLVLYFVLVGVMNLKNVYEIFQGMRELNAEFWVYQKTKNKKTFPFYISIQHPFTPQSFRHLHLPRKTKTKENNILPP